jgi:hypothetical protein
VISLEDGKVSEYIVVRDHAAEYPAGSGRYKHEVYLMESIKLFDGILCSSITFTNSKGRDYKITSGKIIPATSMYRDNGVDDPIQLSDVLGAWVSPLPVILSGDESFTLPTPREVTESLAVWLNRVQDAFTFTPIASFVAAGNTIYSSITVSGLSVVDWNESITVTPESPVTVKYECALDSGEAGGLGPERITFTAEISVVNKRKMLAKYTITDCVLRVLELAFPLRGEASPQYTFDGITYTDGVASAPVPGSQAEKYSKVYAPEFTMTQATLREQLKVIGKYIHAEPELIDGVVRYREYGATALSDDVNEVTPYISRTYGIDINQYCTDIRSNAQNLISSLSFIKGCVTEPAGGLYKSLRSETRYVRVNEQTGEAETNQAINNVPEVTGGVKCGIDNGYGEWTLAPVDITPYVVEATEYNRLSSFNGDYPNAKEYAIYYTIGEKNLKGLFYRATVAEAASALEPFAISNILATAAGMMPLDVQNLLIDGVARLVFQITYQPISSAFVSHGKQRYDRDAQYYAQIYGQGENQIESEAYGESLKGVAARLGNVEQERTYIYPGSMRVPRTGDCIEDGGEIYSISAVSAELMPFYTKFTLGLTRKFDRISEYVGINSIKRMYEVSERQAQERQILLKEYAVLTSDASFASSERCMFKSPARLLSAFKSNYKDRYVKFASFRGYSKKGEPINDNLFWLPCVARSFGNSIHFSFTMLDNYSAGTSVKKVDENGITGWIQRDEPYADYYGRIYWADIKLSEDAIIPGSNEYVYTIPALNAEGVNPYISYVADTGENKHRLRKDGREIISYNIEVEFKTTEDDIVIGSALAEYCDLVYPEGVKLSTYLTNSPPNVLGQYYTPNAEDLKDELFYSVGSEGDLFLSSLTPNFKDYKYWVICTELVVESEEALNEDGEIISQPIRSGGKILLAGSTAKGFNVFGNRNLYLRLREN